MNARAQNFSETHRKILGARLHGIESKLREARELGLRGDTLATLQAEVEQLRDEVDALLPPPPPHLLRAALIEVLTLAYEIRPSALRAYGALSEEGASYLEERSLRLGQLAERLLDETSGKTANGGSR